MAEKTVRRTIAERREAMLAELAELAGKEIQAYTKELDAKSERLAKVEDMLVKYTAEAKRLNARIAELKASIDELSPEAQAEEIEAA